MPLAMQQNQHSMENQEQRCFLYFLRVLKVLSVISMLLNITTYIIVVKAVTESPQFDDLEKTYVTLSMIGYMVFSIILIVAEFDPPQFMQFVMVFHYWAGRGFGMVWLAIQTLAQTKSFSETVGNEADISPGVLNAFGNIAGWIIFGVGFLYIIFSVLCLRKCLGEDAGELEVSLIPKGAQSNTVINSSVGSAAGGGAGGNMADAMLIANMAVALGMPPDTAKSQFSGKHGGRAAQDFAKKRAEDMGKGMAQGAMNHAREQPGMQNALYVGDAVTTAAADAHHGSKQQSTVDDSSAGNDDDALEKAYYASMM